MSTTLTEDLILNLKVIAKLAEHETGKYRLNVRTGEPIIEKNGVFSFLTRFVNGESRVKTIDFITKTYHNCSHVVDLFLNSTFLQMSNPTITGYQSKKASDIVVCLGTIASELEQSFSGLDALKQAYTEDFTTCAKIDILQVKAQRMILQIAECVEQTKRNIQDNNIIS